MSFTSMNIITTKHFNYTSPFYVHTLVSKKTTCVQGAMSRKATSSTCTRTEKEDTDEQEGDSAKHKADEVRSTTTTPNFGRKTQANEELSQEGGVSTVAKVVKT